CRRRGRGTPPGPSGLGHLELDGRRQLSHRPRRGAGRRRRRRPRPRRALLMTSTLGVDALDSLRTTAREILRNGARRLADLRYADLRAEVIEARTASAENGNARSSGDEYRFALGVRVLAGHRAVAAGWIGLTLGAADVADIERIVADALGRAYRRAIANAEMKADAREKFGSLGASLADTVLHPIDAREGTVPAAFRVEPRAMVPAATVQ